MSENTLQEPGPVRADYLQRFIPRERMRARLNIRAKKSGTYKQAFVHGLDLLALTPLSPPETPLFDEFDDGGTILVTKTPLGNWSSDGDDTAPLTGPWLFIERILTTETVDGETEEDDEAYPSVTQDVVQWVMTYWEDNVQDTGFLWKSEILAVALAEDVFAFRTWRPDPDLETTELEDDSVPATATVWLEPIEPGITIAEVEGLRAELDDRLKLIAVTPITDAAMVALGFTEQIEAETSAGVVFIPIASTAWT
jgi:hypothetical protein